MAGIKYTDSSADQAQPASRLVQRLTAGGGALTSVALIVGLAVWGYKLTMRDVSGVPVIQALEGPMRVAPEDPGGRQAEHQGLAVNRVAALGEAAPPPDRLVLAPRPVELTGDDLPRADLGPRAPVSGPETPLAEAAPAPAVILPPPAAELAAPVPENAGAGDVPAMATREDPTAAAVQRALQEAMGLSQDDAAALVETTPVTATPETVQADVVPAIKGGLTHSPYPAARPLVSFVSARSDDAPVAVQELSADAVLPGTNLVQLGAYDTPDIARAEWQRLSGRFGSFMEGKKLLIQPAVSGGMNFYRLRAVGFADIADARRFCAALTAEKADCIPVVAR